MARTAATGIGFALGGPIGAGIGNLIGGTSQAIRGANQKRKAAERNQTQLIGRQKQREDLRLAEADSEIGRRRLLAKAGGRRSLIASR